MSNADSSDDRAKKPPASSTSGTGKKSKSKGFIESADFKPGWLETGPLPADVLPSLPDPAGETSIADELAALQETLQRLYGGEAQDTAEAPPGSEDEPPAGSASPVAAEEAVVEETAAEEAAADTAATTPPTVIEEPAELEETVSEAMLPEAVVPEAEAVVPEAVVPEAVAPEAVAPEAVVPEAVVPEAVVPENVASDEDAPEEDESPSEARAPVVEEPSIEQPAAAEPLLDAWSDAEDTAGPLPLPIFFAEQPLEEMAAEEAPAADTAAPPAARQARRTRAPRAPRPARRPLRRPSRLSTAMLVISLLLLAAAALIYFVNPFVRLALATASLARPVSTPSAAAPGAADSGDWCVMGNFTEDSRRLLDDGSQGDVLADDGVFSLEYTVAQPGHYLWQVVDCADQTRAFPSSMAWITAEQPNQPVTFLFDSNKRADRLFFPIPYAITALDSATDYHVIGSFQDWTVDDASGRLEPLGGGLYQQVRRIARSGNYQSYVIAGDPKRAIDAYGRTTKPIPFAFDTDHNGDYVVFLVDIDRGRASVMYDMPPLMTKMAFGGGNLRLALALTALAGLLLLALLLRELTLRNRRLWMETGCPRCHEQELMRISRRPRERLLHLMAIPAYRYRCRNCTWEGTRLSEAGRSISPGATIARTEGVR